MKRHVESTTSEEEDHHAMPQHKRVKSSPQDAAKLLLSLSFGSQNNDRDQQGRIYFDSFNAPQAIVSDDEEEEEDEHEAPAARLPLPVAPTDWRLIFRPLALPPRLPSVPKGSMINKNQIFPRLKPFEEATANNQ